MKAIVIQKYGGPEELEYKDIEKPAPKAGEVLIKIVAASINPVDWKIREGRLKFLSGRKFPLSMGTELAGQVEQVGEEHSQFERGDRVFAGLSHKGGAYAEYVAVSENKVFKIPDALSYRDASTLAVAGLTPLQAMTIHFPVEPGNRVLINGASGGVGTYAVQIAKLLGAHVTAVCSARNAELVRSLGADVLIDYNVEDFRERIAEFDLILDAAANAFFPSAKACLKPAGMLIKLNLSFKSLFLSIWTRFFSSRKLKMILVKNRPQDLAWMIDQITSGKIKVIIDKVFPLEEARQAQEYSQSGRARGKIIIEI